MKVLPRVLAMLLLSLGSAPLVGCDAVDAPADGDVPDAGPDAMVRDGGPGDGATAGLQLSGPIPGYAEVGQVYRFVPNASTAGAAALEFSVTGLPSWATFDTTDGALEGTPAEIDLGPHRGIEIRVTDGVDTLSLPPRTILVTTSPEAARSAQAALTDGSPELIGATWTRFCQTHFGAEREAAVYQTFGDTMSVVPASSWVHASERSAVIAWQTSLPALTHVEIDGVATEEAERCTATHLHFVRGLEPGTTYTYHLVSTDERGNVLRSAEETLVTSTEGSAVHIPADMGAPPYRLDMDDATYVLTEDVVADGTAFEITGDNITLDLGGHRVTYANVTEASPAGGDMLRSSTGVWSSGTTVGARIVNGVIHQGATEGAGASDGSLAAIYLASHSDVEVAGVSTDFHTAQTYALYFRNPNGTYDVHHNVITDLGWEVLDRHGASGSRAISLAGRPVGENDFSLHHNLVARARQNAIGGAQRMEYNEIYTDSWSTNSFAIGPNSAPDVVAGNVSHNRIFLSGYHAIGISWAHLDLEVVDNFIHMESVDTGANRWYEDFGDRNSLNGLRLTNYGSGGQVRDNLHYGRNVIVGTCRDGVEMRGTELFSDFSVTNVVVDDSIIRVEVADDETTQAAAVVTQGTPNDNHAPLFYRNTTLTSNIANVRFGDYYGRGHNHRFEGCSFERSGDNGNYHTFVFDGGFSTGGHVILDPTFEGGAAYDDVYWQRTGALSHYSVQWTLTLSGEAGADIEIRDASGDVEFSGTMPSSGMLAIPLTQATIRPTEWTAGGGGGGVSRRDEHQEITLTPHTVTVTGSAVGTETVTMDAPMSLSL